MRPRGPLMKEHRLIEKMIARIEKEIDSIKQTGDIDPDFISAASDFIRVYADRTHHGKEEDILFKALDGKKLSDGHETQKKNLIGEHEYGRGLVKNLGNALADFQSGDPGGRDKIVEIFQALVDFYPGHIWKEDRIFFPETESYFSESEMQDMLEAFRDFDRRMIHDKYKRVVEAWETPSQERGGRR